MARFLSSLRSRLMLLVLLSALPALGLTLYTGFEQRRIAAESVKESALRLTRLAATNQAALAEGARQMLISMAFLPQLRDSSSSECSAFLAELHKSYPSYSVLAAVTPEGDIYCSSSPSTEPTNIADRQYFQEMLQTRDFVIGDYILGRISNEPVLPFIYPVYDETGQLVYAVLATLDLDWLDSLISAVRLPEGAAILTVDDQGTILSRFPDPDAWVGKQLPEAPLISALLSRKGEGTLETTGLDGVLRLYAFTILESNSGGFAYVGVGIPENIAYAEVNRATLRNAVSIVAVTVLALIAASYISKVLLLDQIYALLNSTNRIAGGDLTARSRVPYKAGELG
ncbi:MAG: hypothetical protein EHM70_05020, partial [Chloroflexota bacterium]